MKLLVAAAIAGFLLGAVAGEVGGQPTATRSVGRDAPYRAYWLTAEAGDPSYQLLVFTRGPVEDLAGRKAWSPLPLDNMAMTFQTYGRDSLWKDPFRNVGQFGAVDEAAKKLTVDGDRYHYEPCSLEDAVRLLENPLGTMPIHRRQDPLAEAKQTTRAFLFLLREQIKAE